MKNVLFAFVLFALTLTSCKKEELPSPTNPSGGTVQQTISVEYRLHISSGHATVTSLVAGDNGMEEKTEEVHRTTHSIKFDCQRGEWLSVKAKNLMPSADEIKAEIYVNGQLVFSGSATSPNATAVAEGRY